MPDDPSLEPTHEYTRGDVGGIVTTPRAQDAGGVVAISLLDDAGGRRGDAAASLT